MSEINEEIQDKISKNLFEKLMNRHLIHLEDSHFKVINSCLNSLNLLINPYSENILNYLDKIFLNVE